MAISGLHRVSYTPATLLFPVDNAANRRQVVRGFGPILTAQYIPQFVPN